MATEGEVSGGAHRADFLLGRRAVVLLAVEGKGAENLAVRPGDGQRPAGVQPVAQRGLAPGAPVVVDGDVRGDDQPARGCGGRRAVRVGPGTDGQAVDQRVVIRRKVGGGANPQATVRREQQDGTQRTGKLFLDHPRETGERLVQRNSGGDVFE